MNTHIHQTIRTLEQELESYQQSCHEIEAALIPLRRLAGAEPRSPEKTAARNGRTDGRTEQGAGHRAARSLPDGAGESILAQLRKAGGSMKPGDLARALKLTPFALRYQIKPLVKAKVIEVTGVTMSRRVSLPGKSPAKEEPQRRGR